MELSTSDQERAAEFLREQARPLEQALYGNLFEYGLVDDVLTALREFQNPDGGYGNGLEPDLRTAASSVLATTWALQTLKGLFVPSGHPLVAGAMGYLVSTCNSEALVWAIVSRAVQDDPHAPWWDWSDDLAAEWGEYRLNPTAEVLGYLYEYGSLVPEELRQSVTAATMEHLEAEDTDIGMHELLCCARLLDTSALPDDIRERLLARLLPQAERLVGRDAAAWSTYSLRPVDLATGPESPFVPVMGAALDANLDWLIQQQCEDGSWAPSWDWGEHYPDVWPQARREWSGVLTLQVLRTLKSFGRLAE